MAYLRNRAVNWINLHLGIQALAQGMGGTFILAFLLRSGVSVPLALGAMGLIVAGRFSVRPAILFAARRFGIKPLAIAGALGVALQYPMLGRVEGVDATLLAYCAVAAVGDSVYWTCYHAYVAAVGDSEHRGQQISAGVALSALAGIVAPLAGAWALLHVGATATFAVVGAIQVLAAAPLVKLPNVRVPSEAD